MSFIRTDKWTYKVLALVSAVTLALSLGMVAAMQPAQAADTATNVTLKLTDSNGAPLSGATAEYYGKANGSTASTWNSFGTTGSDGAVAREITPGKVTFKLTYKHTQQSKSVTVSGESDQVEFQTTPATVSLKDSSGNPIQGAAASYYGTATAWQSMGTTGVDGTATSEVLPGAISFAVSYKGGREQQSKVAVGASAIDIDFKTKPVTLKLTDQNGNPLTDGDFVLYGLAADGWVKHGKTGANGTIETELLNGSYAVHMTYLKKLYKATVVVDGDPAGHTFVVEVEQPAVPGDDNSGNEGNNENGNQEGGNNNPGDDNSGNEGDSENGNEEGDGTLPELEEGPLDEEIETPPTTDTDGNNADAVNPSSTSAVVELHEDSLSSEAPTDDADNAEANGTLAKTGSVATFAGVLAAILLAVGGGMIGMSRRKHNS
ncbi:MAG: LPXTG cell wall anchor domain-containing protein [Candidatus Nanopelagicales bacterium]